MQPLSPIVTCMRDICASYASQAGALEYCFTPIIREKDQPAEDAAAEFRFSGFEIAFLYSARIGNAKSVLECRIGLAQGDERIDFSLYDLMYLLDENDFRCYLFPYIESPERMEVCLAVLTAAIDRYRPQLTAIGNDERIAAKAKTRKLKEMTRFFKQNILEDAQTQPDLILELRLHSYWEWYVLRFCSSWYACYLRGDYEKAGKKFASYVNKSDYELRLYRFIRTLNAGASYDAVDKACNTYMRKSAARNPALIPAYALCTVAVCVPCFAVYFCFYLLAYLCIYHEALYCSSLWSGGMLFSVLICTLPTGAGIAYFLYRRMLPARLRDALARESGITGTRADRKAMRATVHSIIVASIVLLTFTAKSGVALYPDGIVDNTAPFSQKIEYFSQITDIYRVQDTQTYYLRFSDGELFACSQQTANQYILPKTDLEITPAASADEIIR